MDTQFKVNRLAAKLYRRSTHRFLGNPSLGALTAFLTLLFLIRIAANLYLVIDLANRGAALDTVQIASMHFCFLSAYLILVGSLAVRRISFTVPRLCFINLTPFGGRFRSLFLRQTALLRPMNLISLSLILLLTLLLSIISGDWHAILARALIALAFTSLGIVIVTAVASWSCTNRSETMLMETLYMLLLVVSNPDIAFFEQDLRISIGGIHYAFQSTWQVAFAIGLMVIPAVIALFILKFMTVIGNFFRLKLALSPLERWYWRIIRIRSWILLYFLTIPILRSPFISPGAKRWALILAILFGLTTYLYFIVQCENTLNAKWRRSLFDRGNFRLIIRSLLIHITLVLIPVVLYLGLPSLT